MPDLKDGELAEHLADTLTDLEFELLVRTRIKQLFEREHQLNQEFNESYNTCSFTYSWGDHCTWNVAIGTSYRDQTDTSGEVLSICVRNVVSQWYMKNGNKLSLLLEGPKSANP